MHARLLRAVSAPWCCIRRAVCGHMQIHSPNPFRVAITTITPPLRSELYYFFMTGFVKRKKLEVCTASPSPAALLTRPALTLAPCRVNRHTLPRSATSSPCPSSARFSAFSASVSAFPCSSSVTASTASSRYARLLLQLSPVYLTGRDGAPNAAGAACILLLAILLPRDGRPRYHVDNISLYVVTACTLRERHQPMYTPTTAHSPNTFSLPPTRVQTTGRASTLRYLSMTLMLSSSKRRRV